MSERASGERVAWFNCSAGIAGDMALGALVDAGASIEAIRAELTRLAVSGWELRAERVQRAGLAATHVVVHCDEAHHHRGLRDVLAIIDDAELNERVRRRANAVFTTLAEAEAQVHGCSPDDVHFHEVGAVDAIVDIVGVAVALELLDIDIVECGPIALGHGTITAAHGTLPNPAPAVVRLLQGFTVVGVDTPVELTTPTGAALMASLVDRAGTVPTMTITGTGFGAGTTDIKGRPNVTHVVIGERAQHAVRSATQPTATQPAPTVETLSLIETNLDDVTAETMAYTVTRLLDAGALDAWVTPIIMKKGRAAHSLHALCGDDRCSEIVAIIKAETGTLGVRSTSVQRWPSPRSTVLVDVGGQSIAVKRGPDGSKAEFDDVARAAAALERPLRWVRAAAEAAAQAEAAARTTAPP
jgi:pyridinium-3,5-bisthiocarboxylic acid mononucleotide nickel chelatase